MLSIALETNIKRWERKLLYTVNWNLGSILDVRGGRCKCVYFMEITPHNESPIVLWLKSHNGRCFMIDTGLQSLFVFVFAKVTFPYLQIGYWKTEFKTSCTLLKTYRRKKYSPRAILIIEHFSETKSCIKLY